MNLVISVWSYEEVRLECMQHRRRVESIEVSEDEVSEDEVSSRNSEVAKTPLLQEQLMQFWGGISKQTYQQQHQNAEGGHRKLRAPAVPTMLAGVCRG